MDRLREDARPKSSKIALKWGKLNSGRQSNPLNMQAENKLRKYQTAGIRSQVHYGSAAGGSRSPDSDRVNSVGVLPVSQYVQVGNRFR